MEEMKEQATEDGFWKDHLLKSLKFKGSDRAYCEENGLSVSIFSRQKRQLGLTRSQSRRRSGFVRIESQQTDRVPSSESKELLDPKWFAEVLRHLHGMR